jgi:hypothetical protein
MEDARSGFFETFPISNELPKFITETDPSIQTSNIENMLGKFFNIDGFAISVFNDESVIRHTHKKEIHEHLLDQLDRIFFSGQDANIKETSVIPFEYNNGNIAAISGGDFSSPAIGDANGLALYLKGMDFTGGMYLITDNQTVSYFTSNLNQTQNLISLLASLLSNSYVHFHNSEKMRFFSLYETVSSALGYVGDLQELLTTIISIVMAELPSEEGSVLLLDESTNELEFFSAIGETGFGLTQLRFPADKGIAGHALTHREAIIVNDTETCPFFFKNIDQDSGFKTKSILAVPLVSGEECIGVIEAINKVGSDSFDEQDKRILMAIADEVALAIKNARLFDYVVDSYCNIRQGKMTCKGCVRPLKSWTPCARQLDKV